MARKIIPATDTDVESVDVGARLLRRALKYLKACPQTASKVRSAIKSADGALRHVRRRRNVVSAVSLACVALILAPMPADAARGVSRGASRGGTAPAMSFVRHGEMEDLAPPSPQLRRGPQLPEITKGLAYRPGTLTHQRALLCQPLPRAMQAGCMEWSD